MTDKLITEKNSEEIAWSGEGSGDSFMTAKNDYYSFLPLPKNLTLENAETLNIMLGKKYPYRSDVFVCPTDAGKYSLRIKGNAPDDLSAFIKNTLADTKKIRGINDALNDILPVFSKTEPARFFKETGIEFTKFTIPRSAVNKDHEDLTSALLQISQLALAGEIIPPHKQSDDWGRPDPTKKAPLCVL
jgi:hypothetical protein